MLRSMMSNFVSLGRVGGLEELFLAHCSPCVAFSWLKGTVSSLDLKMRLTTFYYCVYVLKHIATVFHFLVASHTKKCHHP